MSEDGSEGARSKWRENHGNFLVGFVGLVFVIGAALVAYRQSQSHSSQSPRDVRRRPAVVGPPLDPAGNPIPAAEFVPEDASPVVEPSEAGPADGPQPSTP